MFHPFEGKVGQSFETRSNWPEDRVLKLQRKVCGLFWITVSERGVPYYASLDEVKEKLLGEYDPTKSVTPQQVDNVKGYRWQVKIDPNQDSQFCL